MSGSQGQPAIKQRLLLDTNAVIALLQGNEALAERSAAAVWIGVSIISRIEALSYPALSENDSHLLTTFFQRVNVIPLTAEQPDLIDAVVHIRQQKVLKLPDAIIVASALTSNATLVTADKDLIQRANVESWNFAFPV